MVLSDYFIDIDVNKTMIEEDEEMQAAIAMSLCAASESKPGKISFNVKY